MGVLIQIRDVPEEVRRRLKARAASKGESLNEHLRRLLEEAAARPTREELFARIESRGRPVEESSAGLIRAERDARS